MASSLVAFVPTSSVGIVHAPLIERRQVLMCLGETLAATQSLSDTGDLVTRGPRAVDCGGVERRRGSALAEARVAGLSPTSSVAGPADIQGSTCATASAAVASSAVRGAQAPRSSQQRTRR